jgi:hypothetical protein
MATDITRRALAATLGGAAAIIAPRMSWAQPAKMPRVGVLLYSNPQADPNAESFRRGAAAIPSIAWPLGARSSRSYCPDVAPALPGCGCRLRLLPDMFDNAQLADRQFIDLQHAKARLLDHETTDRKAADRHRSDGHRTHCRRAQRKRQQADSGIGFGSRRYVSRHWNLHRVRRLR